MTEKSESFAKILTPTDVGETGAGGGRSHQSGIDVRKNQVDSFPPLDESEINPEIPLLAVDDAGRSVQLRFVHFNKKLHGLGTRDVYRITGIGEYLRDKRARSGDRVTLVRNAEGSYRMDLLQDTWRSQISDYEADTDPSDDDPFKRVMRGIQLRRGQPAFRTTMMRLYDRSCAISGWKPEDVLEAAHIEPHSVGGRNSADNGLLLRADLHTLMDAGLLAVDPRTLQILVHTKLIGTGYEQYAGQDLRVRTDGTRPNPKYLRDRYERAVGEHRHEFIPFETGITT